MEYCKANHILDISCSTLINTVMKYLNFRSSAQSWRALHASLLKVALRQRYFLKNFTTSAEQRY